MNKLLVILAIVLPCGPFLLARQAVNDLPQRVDAGGHLLRLHTVGTGSPAVVLEIGLGGFLEEWAAVQPDVAKLTQVVAYDRIGAQHTEKVLAGEQLVRELHTALQTAKIRPPYVLVGQSFGGVYNRLFAQMYPNEVAGLVLLDPSQEEFIHWMHEHHPEKDFKPKDLRNWPELAGIFPTLKQLKTTGTLPDVPVVVVSATRPSEDRLHKEVLPMWIESHDSWVKTLPHGRHVLAPESGHGIHVEAPQLVIDLIQETVEQARQRSGSDHEAPL
jgi:pimeloyl-ACP methyl ester carboxylesterase